MLNIITGRTGSGKTRYIRNLATEIAKNESGKVIIIVPDQFSFETEKGMLELLGNEKINNIEFLSFSRIAERLLRDYGKITKKSADDATRAVLMSMAIESLQDKLVYYKKYQKNPLLINELLSFNNELKTCCITIDQLAETAEKVKKPTFAKKLDELSNIFQCYDSLMSKNFHDDSLNLDLFAELLYEVPYFKDKTVFVDAFTWFSAQEHKILERIIATADDVYITFCCDTVRNNGEYELFYNAMCEIRKLRATANRVNVKVAPEKILYADKVYKTDALNFLEENIFDITDKEYETVCDSISLVPCRNKNDECDFVAAEIKRLVREENYRYRDVAVIERTQDTYKKQLMSSFRKYGIDCFPDNRQPILAQPLMAFMLSLFDILTEGFNSEYVLRFLKTGLYGFTIEEISLVEDYVLMWRTKQSEWKNEWTGNPEGFGVEFNEYSEQKLKTINDLRARIVGPIVSLKNKITETNGETISRELFAFLRNTGVDNNLKNFTTQLMSSGEDDLALEQGKIWRILTEILDSLCSATGDSAITLKRYRELFEIIVSTKDIGQIPNGVDEVIIGSADRIKSTAPKAVFIVGANAGVFPVTSSSGAILNDTERCELQSNGVDIISNLAYNSVLEKFIAYRAMTLATHKLYVSYSSVDSKSEALSPSELVFEINRLYEDKANVINPDSLSLIESRKTAFSALASESNQNSILGSTLYEYFVKDGSQEELNKLEKMSKKEFKIQDNELATDLFGKSMYISASKTEKFYLCPFSYFCEYGIKAQPRREAQMDPAQTGTLIHEVLEIFLKENPKDKFIKFTTDEVKEKVNKIIDNYVDEKLSGYENQPKSFRRTMTLLKERSLKLVMQLIDEFSNCEFVPVNFELSINNDGDIAPYLIDLDNGGTVKIIGKVDRVDIYTTPDNTFVRIVDYKTGGKIFDLGEVFAGLNMQMLIYLFAIWQNGGELYKNVTPAGIFYFQAKTSRATETAKGLNRHSDDTEINKNLKDKFRMSGMVLNNIDVITAMEKNAEGVYIPAVINDDGSVSGNVISLKNIERLKNKVNELIKGMASDLQSGVIRALPTEEGCRYCNYHDVCRRGSDDPIREFDSLNFQNAVSMLGGDDDEQNMD
ncbi:MAG: PD-(D/E)XK nuclease family protein [Clostridia bacterium]|nr:PD-(D/E)XK nuclease family protein [Clostridia bacterium]